MADTTLAKRPRLTSPVTCTERLCHLRSAPRRTRTCRLIVSFRIETQAQSRSDHEKQEENANVSPKYQGHEVKERPRSGHRLQRDQTKDTREKTRWKPSQFCRPLNGDLWRFTSQFWELLCDDLRCGLTGKLDEEHMETVGFSEVFYKSKVISE